METRIASTSSCLSSNCVFLAIARPKGPDRARIRFEHPSDMGGENKNNMLAEAKQSIFNSRPWRKIHELLSMATSRFYHVCCLHSLLLPFLFSFSNPSFPLFLPRSCLHHSPQYLAFAGNHFATGCLHITDVSPLQQCWLCLAHAHRIQIFLFQEVLPGTKQVSHFLSCPLPLLFFPLKLLKPPPYPCTVFGRGRLESVWILEKGRKLADGCLIKLQPKPQAFKMLV